MGLSVPGGRNPHHLGFVVPDADEFSSVLAQSLGQGRRAAYSLDLSDDEIEMGEPGSIKIVLLEVGSLLFEVIEPLGDGDTVWRRALRTRGPGMHHIAYTRIPSYVEAVHSLRDDRFDVSVAGRFGDNRWCYLEKDGLVIEITSGDGPSIAHDRSRSGRRAGAQE